MLNVIHTDIFLKFGKAPVKIFPGIIELQHPIDPRQMGLLRERYAELLKGRLLYCCKLDWMTSGGQILRNVTPLTDRKTPFERKFGKSI